MASTLDVVFEKIRSIQKQARKGSDKGVPPWPMIVLRTPKGWTGPKEVNQKPVENTWRSHHLPIGGVQREEHLCQLEQWMKSYKPEELFDQKGALLPELAELAPKGMRMRCANPS